MCGADRRVRGVSYVPGERSAVRECLGIVVRSDFEGRARVDDLELSIGPVDCAVVAGVASQSAETHGAGICGEAFFRSVGASEDEFESRKHASSVNRGRHGAKERALTVVGRGQSPGWAEITLFPIEKDRVSVRIAAGRRKNEGGSRGDGIFGTSVDARRPIFARSGLRAVG